MRSAHRFALWRLLPGALVLFAVALSGCGTNSAAAGKEGQATPSQNGGTVHAAGNSDGMASGAGAA